MRIGLLGGTFDPVHQAHLRIAQAAARQCGLHRVLLVPAANPPHRARGTIASYADRLRMVEIACAGSALMAPSNLDDAPGKSYSIHTVERLRSTLTPGDEIFFLIGADAFAELRTWHRWKELAHLATFAVIDRPEAVYDTIEEVRVQRVTGVDLPISSSAIRARLPKREPLADLPPGVLDYIRAHHLYGLP